MTEQKQDKATARPVSLMIEPGQLTFYLVEPGGGYIAKTCGDSFNFEKMAKHICQCVNEYSALCAIAEAADSLNKRVIFTAAAGSPVKIANDKLYEALAALAKLRS